MGWFESRSGGVIGDDVLDIMETAVRKARKEFNKEWDREPTKDELRDAFNYVLKPLELSPTGKDEDERIERDYPHTSHPDAAVM